MENPSYCNSLPPSGICRFMHNISYDTLLFAIYIPTQETTGNLGKSGRRRGGLPQGRAHELIVQGQMASPESIHTDNIMWTDQDTYVYMYVYVNVYIHMYMCVTCMHACMHMCMP